MWIFWSALAGVCLVPFYVESCRLMARHNFEFTLFMMNRLWISAVLAVMTLPWADTWLEWFVIATGIVYGMATVPFQKSYRYVTEIDNAVTGVTIPLIAAVIGFAFMGENMSPRQTVAFVLLVAGPLVTVFGAADRKRAGTGYRILLLAALFAGVYNAGTKLAKNLGDFNPAELFFLARTGVFITMAGLFATRYRRGMLGYFKLPGADIKQFVRNELFFLSFAACFAAAMTLQPKTTSNGLIGVIYFGVLQIGLFFRAWLIGQDHMKRKLAGAAIALVGLILLALR